MRIYLDDERTPKVEKFDHIVRNFTELTALVLEMKERISYISFDHDLGNYDKWDGYDAVKWLCELDLVTKIFTEDFTFNVHSANPVGANNIRCYLTQYLKML